MSPAEILKEFGHLAETEGGIEQLRALVVELAVTGKIEGCQFSGSSKTLGEAIPLIQTGPFGSLLHKADYVDGGTPLINPINLVKGSIVPDSAKAVSEKTLKRLSLYRVAAGDVMLARRGEMGRTAVVSSIEEGWLCGTGSMFLRPPKTVSPPYLALWLSSPGVRLKLTGGAVGTTMSNLNQRILTGLRIVVPPLPEQRRIVEKVDQLMALCDELEAKQKQKRAKAVVLNKAALSAVVLAPGKAQLKGAWSRVQDHFEVLYELPENVKELRQTILQLAVMGKLVRQEGGDESGLKCIERAKAYLDRTEARSGPKVPWSSESERPAWLPSNWEWVALGQIIRISSGVNLTSTSMNSSGTVPVFGGNGVTGYHDVANVDEPTLVLGRVGYYCGSIHITPPSAWVTDNAFKVRFDRESLNMRFLALVLQSCDLRQDSGATAQPVISGRKVYPTKVGVPSFTEQRFIVAKMDQLMALCDELEAKLAQHRDQGQRLMQAVVEGLVA